ncbi:MAG: DUF3999 family protein, partial [Chloroflexi bacterium]|nr:DUF3999 family protein [Chloroflexota bacterium]
EVPYKLLVERGEERRGSINVTLRDLGHVPGQYTSFVVDLGREGVLHNELEVLTPSQNFQRRVVVEGSGDGQLWAVVQEKGQIYDFTIVERGFTSRYLRVRYPSSTARYLRVRIINGAEPPLDVTGAVAYFSQELPPRETEAVATIAGRQEESEKRRTMLLLELGSPGFPSSRLSIATSQENFYRQVSLEGSDDAQAWVSIQGSEVLYSYNTPKFVGSKLSVQYPESTYSYLRLTILNEDNPPLPVSEARAYGFLRRVIFSASPGGTYRLSYGNATARQPSYELERIFPYLVTENLPAAQLGPHTANPLFTIPQKPLTERYPWLLPTAVALAGVLIGLFLANLLREVRRLLPPPASPP